MVGSMHAHMHACYALVPQEIGKEGGGSTYRADSLFWGVLLVPRISVHHQRWGEREV